MKAIFFYLCYGTVYLFSLLADALEGITEALNYDSEISHRINNTKYK
jgi:hypothetical protein